MAAPIAPEWHTQRFYNNVMADLERNNEVVMEWFISKPTMIATLNFLRSNGLKCEWIEKRDGLFIIKITKSVK